MVSEFLIPFGRLNLSFLPEDKVDRLLADGLTAAEAVEVLEYGRNLDGYWDGKKLLEQVTQKALPIAEALFPGYAFLLLFDNATSHATFANDALRTSQMNKGSGGKQAWLRSGYYHDANGNRHEQPMFFEDDSGKRCQKGIQMVLEERGLWPEDGLPLECFKPKCNNCQVMATCQSYTKGQSSDVIGLD